MASDVLQVCDELDPIVGNPIARSAEQARKLAVGSAWRAASRWISLGVVAAGVGALGLHLPGHPVSIRSYPLEATTSLPASLYFDAAHAAFDAENLQSIVAIAKAVRSSPTPVVVAAYADPLGNRDQNLRFAQKRAAGVREALVMAGVPTLRVVLVSPTFAADNGPGHIEISLVHGVRAFPARGRQSPLNHKHRVSE
jgi:outer membrane protein OmpA-like peptidoglycan-associated protein